MSQREQIEMPLDLGSENRSRSTPLKPAIWMTGVLAWATVIGLIFRVPTVAGIFLCSLTGISFLVYLVSYIFLMATDREALRAERYSMKSLPPSQRSLRLTVPSTEETDQKLAANLEPHA
jgi:hypothetical protein